jgi:rhodanese-related sulfurtransferase
MRRIKKITIFYVVAAIVFIGALTVFSNNFSTSSKKDIMIDKGTKNNIIEKEIKAFSNVTPKEAKQRLDNKEEIILLDVRTKEEYDSGHIKGSMLIPVDVLDEEVKNKLMDKNATIFVYCRSGNRSVTAANILIKQGYTNVYNLGGIQSWPYEVVR